MAFLIDLSAVDNNVDPIITYYHYNELRKRKQVLTRIIYVYNYYIIIYVYNK